MVSAFDPPRLVFVALDHAHRGPSGKYVTTRRHTYRAAETKLEISVPAGFRTDFASLPRLLWSVLEREGPWARAALFHDWMYRTQTVSRSDADAIFSIILAADGVSAVFRAAFFVALRLFGRRAWDANARRLGAELREALAADLALLTAEGAP